MRYIELLAPAKNLECGLAAINHGADAVYIGAPQFGARANAGNSIADIAALAAYAHRFDAKVLVALNTLLTDRQLPEAEALTHRLYEAGADALIVQDMGILQLDLPPIALHASTQTDNRTPEKVRFLEQAGFSRVVLARELSLEQIQHIASHTAVELEVFVHGALCVSYSGQCYMSQAMCGRSANRGECAQPCRLPYDLVDAEGKVLLRDKHLLSLKDLNQSAHLERLIAAGVSSLKIEGRLKDREYVQNITAFYRQRLDAILNGTPAYRRASSGTTTFFFEPDPAKSFNRGFTSYFLNGRESGIIQPDTPKSLGEPIGKAGTCGARSFRLSAGKVRINNGDGLCFINPQGALEGFRVNRVEGADIFPSEMPTLTPGTALYRNRDTEFEKLMQQRTAERNILLDIHFEEVEEGFRLRLTDEDGRSVSPLFTCEKQTADHPERALAGIKNQLAKLGGTIYAARSVEVCLTQPYFLPHSTLNQWRRQAVEQLDELRRLSYRRPARRPGDAAAPFPADTLDYTGNITNRQAEAFYRMHGVRATASGFELEQPRGVPLMFCKHCIKYAYGWCPKQGCKEKIAEPLFLRNNGQLYQLSFDCRKCEMTVQWSLPKPLPRRGC